jgi:two-component system phosphate regulon sensor histidine kinase PhoR
MTANPLPLIQSPPASIPLGVVALALVGVLALAMALGGLVAWRLSKRARPARVSPPPAPPSPQLADVLNALPFPAALVGPDGRSWAVNDRATPLWLAAPPSPRLAPPLLDLARRVAASGAAETAPLAVGEGQSPLRVSAVPLLGKKHPYAGTMRDGVLLVGQTGGGESGLNLTRLAAHELRTPLTAIVGHAEILESCDPADEALWRRSRDFIAAEAQRLARLVDDLLTLSRLEAAPLMRPVNVRAVAESALSHLFDRAEAAGLKLTLDAPPSLPRVRADADRLEQALVNLLDNAIKYTPGGGTVTTRLISEGGYVRVEVGDTGPGIAPDDLPHLFEPLYRAESARRLPGTGLGLTIVRAILDQHGAPVSVRSTPGQGTTFTFRLPVAR